MKTCLKCNFENPQGNSEACPKCGAVYAKMERLAREALKAKEQAERERVWNDRLEREFDKEESPSYEDSLETYAREARRDQEAYPVISMLSGFFIILAIMVGAVGLIAALNAYNLLQAYTQIGGVPGQSNVGLFVIMAVSVTTSVAIVLAIAGGLKLGRDIANNTRATREYMHELATRR